MNSQVWYYKNVGLTYLNVKIGNPVDRKLERVKFLVDSGAVYSVVDKNVLMKMKIRPHSRRKFILANGDEIEKDVGDAFFEYGGQKASAPVVFGDKGIYLLGATTLENLGLILNPIDRELRPLPMVI